MVFAQGATKGVHQCKNTKCERKHNEMNIVRRVMNSRYDLTFSAFFFLIFIVPSPYTYALFFVSPFLSHHRGSEDRTNLIHGTTRGHKATQLHTGTVCSLRLLSKSKSSSLLSAIYPPSSSADCPKKTSNSFFSSMRLFTIWIIILFLWAERADGLVGNKSQIL